MLSTIRKYIVKELTSGFEEIIQEHMVELLESLIDSLASVLVVFLENKLIINANV